MGTTFSKNRKFKRMFANILCIAAVLAIAFPVTTVAYASPSSPFVGNWEGIDVDESDIRLVIAGPPSGPYRITWTENYISFCNGEAGIVRGMGLLDEEDPDLLQATLQVSCFTTGASTTFNLVWRYRPASETLISQYEQNGYIIIWHHPGSKVPSLTPPTFVAYVPGAIEGYDWQLGDTVSIDINNGEYTAEAEVEESPWDPAQTRVLFEVWRDEISIEAGDYVVMTDGVVSKDVVVTNLAVTDIDVTAGTVSGIYDPDYSLWVWLYDGEGQVPATDSENGTWVATFIELPPSAWGGATQWEPDGDGTSLDFQVPNTRFTVWPEQNFLEGYEWPDGAVVSISVADKGICSTEATSAFPEWDPSNTFFSVNLPEDCDIGVGDFITLSSGILTLTHQIQELTVTEVNIDANTVTGMALFDPEQYILHTWIHEVDGSYMQLSAEGGNWLADFNFLEGGLQPGMGGRVELVDQASNATAAEWNTPPVMGLRVNYGHDWVESFYETGHQVEITVTESDGETVKATAVVYTEPKDFWGEETGFQTNPEDWSPVMPDLQPYDWVYAQVDNGVTASVQLGEIRGEVDFQTDSITGTILADWLSDPVQVECLDWGSGGESINKDAGSVYPDGASPYSCDWNPETEWNVLPWQDIGVGYSTPDGHWVANAFRDERWMAMWTTDLEPGFWMEGDFGYSFRWMYTDPELVEGTTGPLAMTVSSGADQYPGFVLIQTWNDAPQLAWTGSSCEAVPAVHPDQPTRFIWGWVNDYSMTYDEALAHFGSFTVTAIWGGATEGSAPLTMGELIPFTSRDDRWEYRCSLTGY